MFETNADCLTIKKKNIKNKNEIQKSPVHGMYTMKPISIPIFEHIQKFNPNVYAIYLHELAQGIPRFLFHLFGDEPNSETVPALYQSK